MSDGTDRAGITAGVAKCGAPAGAGVRIVWPERSHGFVGRHTAGHRAEQGEVGGGP
jgi:hypothetical protein